MLKAQKPLKDGYTINHATGMQIKIGGPTHKRMVKAEETGTTVGRKAPNVHASIAGEHTQMLGSDGELYKVKRTELGLKWFKCSKSATGRVACVGGQSENAPAVSSEKLVYERKAPRESARQAVIESGPGAQRTGLDGEQYIAKASKTGSLRWFKCTPKAGCKSVGDAQNSRRSNNQRGGNALLAALAEPLSGIAVPATLTALSYFAPHFLGKSEESEKTQRGGGGSCPASKRRGQKAGSLLSVASELAVPAVLVGARELISDHWLDQVYDRVYEGVNEGVNNVTNAIGFNKKESQRGGNLMGVMNGLLTPVALVVARDLIGKYGGHRQVTQKQEQEGGAVLPVVNDPIMSSYLGLKGISLLTPSTLIPLGVLLAVYSAYKNRYTANNQRTQATQRTQRTQVTEFTQKAGGSLESQLAGFVDPADIQTYKNQTGTGELTPQTKVPFAVLMGSHTFKDYVNHQKKSASRFR
jgi:hypothetical protein